MRKTRIRALYLGILFYLLTTSLGLVFPNTSQAKIQNGDIQKLEDEARHAYKEGDFAKALQKYEAIENKLSALKLAQGQSELLYNQAILFLELHEYGQAAARLQQIQIINPSAKIEQMLSETRYIIEYKTYQKHPNTAFVRGHSNAFILWSHTHQYSLRRYTIVVLLSWTVLLISLLSLYLLRKNKDWIWLIKTVASLSFIVSSVCLGHLIVYKITDKNDYAVITSSDILRKEPRLASKALESPETLPAMVVRIVKENKDWVLIERSDNATLWILKDHLYPLSGSN